MWSLNGQWYSSTMWATGLNQANIVAASYGSRTCLGLSGASSAWGEADFKATTRSFPSATASTDARKMALVHRLRFATETLAVTAGQSQNIARFILGDTGMTSNSRIDVILRIYNDGGTHKAQIYLDDAAGTPVSSGYLGTVTAGTTFYKLETYSYLDKTSIYWNDTFIEDITYAAAKADQRINEVNLYYEDTKCVWHLDDFWCAHEEVGYTTTANYSTTNGSPDDATLFLIEKSVISDAITAGTAEAIDVADGSFGVTINDETDYLAVKILDDNDGGFGVKLAYTASGGWVQSNWSL